MSKRSVLLINRVYPPARGASGRMLRDLARGMAEDGWGVTVLTTGPKNETVQDGKVSVRRVKARLRSKNAFSYIIVWLKLLFAALFIKKPSLIVSLTDPPFLIIAMRFVAAMKRTRHVHWCHDLYPDLLPMVGLNLPSFLSQFLKKQTRKAMKACDKVIVIGRCMAKQLTHSGVDPSRISVIPNWPDYEVLKRSDEAYKPFLAKVKGKVRSPEEQVRDDSPKFRILYAGNLGRMHPILPILDAASFVQEEYPELEFTFVGSGSGFERLSQERAKRGLNNVRLLPYQPIERLRQVLESGDIHLVSMRDEAEGLLVPCKFYAALAVGRPAIFMGPEGCEIAKVIKDFKVGATIPARDAARLVEAILDYRMNGEKWFEAQEKAAEAGKVFVPTESIPAWIKRAKDALSEPI